jgi:uncharacterized membrane protein HdeD (DUF308 family)
MMFSLAINWWSVTLRGVLAILIGIIALALPDITVTALVFLFAGYALLDGMVTITGAVRAVAAHQRWGSLMTEGIAGIAAAVLTALWPAITALTLVLVIAAWAIVTGILQMAAAVRLREFISSEWLLALSGITSVTFGLLVAALPIAGELVVAIWLGAYELVSGVMLVALGFRLRAWGTRRAGNRVLAQAHL